MTISSQKPTGTTETALPPAEVVYPNEAENGAHRMKTLDAIKKQVENKQVADPTEKEMLRAAYNREYWKRNRLEPHLRSLGSTLSSLEDYLPGLKENLTTRYEKQIRGLEGEVETLKAERNEARNELRSLKAEGVYAEEAVMAKIEKAIAGGLAAVRLSSAAGANSPELQPEAAHPGPGVQGGTAPSQG